MADPVSLFLTSTAVPYMRPLNEYVQPNGEPRQVREVYMTSVPTAMGRKSVDPPRKPWEPRLRRHELPQQHEDDWRSHRQIEVADYQYGLRQERGWSGFSHRKMTEDDKRARTSSVPVGTTTLTDAELANLGHDTIKTFQRKPYKVGVAKRNCHGFAETFADGANRKHLFLSTKAGKGQENVTERLTREADGHVGVRKILSRSLGLAHTIRGSGGSSSDS